MRIPSPSDLGTLAFAADTGLLPVIVQHHATGEVLMLGHADAEALRRCLDTGKLWLWSRSRAEYWRKGATSGNGLDVLEMHTDCDRDAVLILARPRGPTCHTGARSCFGALPTLAALAATIASRTAAAPGESYTARLLADPNLRLKKLGEEAVELALACADGDSAGVADEAADLVYHTFVACAGAGVGVEEVLRRLDERRGGRIAPA